MPTATSSVTSRLKLLNGYRTLAGLLAILILVQAWMAANSNQMLYGGEIDIVLHGIVGNVSYLVAVGALVVALVARATKGAIVVAFLVVVLMTTQIGLGYTARTNQAAGSWHIPNGVLLFGLAVFQVTQAQALIRGASTPGPTGPSAQTTA
jgi:hypothetical protein